MRRDEEKTKMWRGESKRERWREMDLGEVKVTGERRRKEEGEEKKRERRKERERREIGERWVGQRYAINPESIQRRNVYIEVVVFSSDLLFLHANH